MVSDIGNARPAMLDWGLLGSSEEVTSLSLGVLVMGKG